MKEVSADEKRDYERFRALVKATEERKPGAMAELQDYLKTNEWAMKLGDLSMYVMSGLIAKLTKSESNRAMFGAVIAERQQQMGFADASGIEQMLIERVVMCWLRLIVAESYCNQIGETIHALSEAHFAERRLTMANNRFLRACDALDRYKVLAQATRIVTAKADLLEARAGEARKANGALRLLDRATG